MYVKEPEERECGRLGELTVVHSGWITVFKLTMG